MYLLDNSGGIFSGEGGHAAILIGIVILIVVVLVAPYFPRR